MQSPMIVKATEVVAQDPLTFDDNGDEVKLTFYAVAYGGPAAAEESADSASGRLGAIAALIAGVVMMN